MPLSQTQTPSRLRTLLATMLASSCALFVVVTGTTHPQSFSGRLLPKHVRGEVIWKTIQAADIEKGVSIPPDINIILHIPETLPGPININTLFGRRGDRVRFWGYCFPENTDEMEELRKRGFPGKVFLSPYERKVRREEELKKRKENFSIFKDLNDDALNQDTSIRGRIRHQIEFINPGASCYFMTSEVVPIGTDVDNDKANSAIERDAGSDAKNPDSDGDGIMDGAEIFGLKTNPMLRDTDGDGLIDGIEDKNRNGKHDSDETDPTDWDSDNDGICDGLCKVNRGLELKGEDKNLDGNYDPGEYDPLLIDSDGDGVLDDQEYYLCKINNGTDC